MKLSCSLVLPIALLALAFSGTTLQAQDDQTRAVQEELRRRSLYFGNVDGRDSAELREATKLYQQRKGFAATGKADRETLRSLGLVPRSPNEPPPTELTLADDAVLPSDQKIDTVAIAQSLSEETGIAPASVVPKKLAQGRGLSSKPSAAFPDAAPAVYSSQRLAQNSPKIAARDLARFASDYLAAMSSNDTKRQLKFYADKVDYYRNGEIDRRIVEQALRRYHARWPTRRYTMGTAIKYSRITPRGEIVMTFPVSFTLKDGQRTVKGETENRIAISAATLDPRIASISEKRIRQ